MSPNWPSLRAMSKLVGTQLTGSGDVCYHGRIIHYQFWLSQRFRVSPRSLKDVIGQSPNVFFSYGCTIESFFLVPLEEKRLLYVAAPSSWREYEPCHAVAMPTNQVFVYKYNTVVELGAAGPLVSERCAYMQVAISDRVIIVVMHFLKRS